MRPHHLLWSLELREPVTQMVTRLPVTSRARASSARSEPVPEQWEGPLGFWCAAAPAGDAGGPVGGRPVL